MDPLRGTVGVVRARVIAAVLTIVVIGSLIVWQRSRDDGLRFTDATPGDLRAVATDAWRRFGAAFPGRADCIDGITVGVAWELRDRARYEPEGALVLVRAPGTAGNLYASLLHEFAHHAEHVCPPDAAFRRRYVAAAELPAGTAWRAGDRWDRTPSERFAEAAVVHVLGERPPHVLIHVRPAEVRLLASWADEG
jgi:hypothetical protein